MAARLIKLCSEQDVFLSTTHRFTEVKVSQFFFLGISEFGPREKYENLAHLHTSIQDGCQKWQIMFQNAFDTTILLSVSLH